MAEERTEAAEMKRSKRSGASVAARVRVVVAQLVWTVAALAALFLAVGALLVAVDANTDNALVRFVLDVADVADVSVFSRRNGVLEFDGGNAEVKNALFNWGLGALAWLVAGRVLDRLIRPGSGR